MLGAVFFDPLKNRAVVVETIGCFFEVVAVQLEKREQVLIETDGLVIVSVKKPLAMELRLVDQTRQMHVTAQTVVRAPRDQLLSHSAARAK